MSCQTLVNVKHWQVLNHPSTVQLQIMRLNKAAQQNDEDCMLSTENRHQNISALKPGAQNL